MFSSITHQFMHFKDKRLLTIFLFGISSGFPWVMIGSTLSAWLKDEGLSRSAIGFFGSIFFAYSINFLWSPLLDKIRLPFLTHRRAWIFTMQLGMLACCVGFSQFDVKQSAITIAGIGFLLVVLSATQDIAIDAYRIDIIQDDEKEKVTAGASMATAGWWTGYGGLGVIPFLVADLPEWYWPDIYLLLAGLMMLLMIPVLYARETYTPKPTIVTLSNQQSITIRLSHWLQSTLVAPFKEFFVRNGLKLSLGILSFIFLFKMGEAFLGRMSIVFYKEIGFSNTEIGTYSKLLNWWVTIVFSIIGGMLNIRFGIFKGMMIAGVAMAASNLMFAVIAHVGPNIPLFIMTVFVDGFTAAWSSVAMVALISLFCDRNFSASQYALMASLGVLGRTTLASGSGVLIDGMDGNWTLFFILTSVMVIPSLFCLYAIRDSIGRQEGRTNA